MDYILSEEFGRRLLPHRLILKMMSKESGGLYLDKYMPDLEGQDRDYALTLCGVNIKPIRPIPDENRFIAGAFLAGVSLGDLARMYGITRQAIQARIARRTTREERAHLRDQLDVLDLEVLQLARDIWREGAAQGSFEGVHVLEIGRSCLKAANSIVIADRGDEPLVARPRRYSNMNKGEKQGKELAIELTMNVTQDMIDDESMYPKKIVEQMVEDVKTTVEKEIKEQIVGKLGDDQLNALGDMLK